MKKIEHPAKGGSYLRHEDGTLERIEGTEPPKPRQQAEMVKPPAKKKGAK